MNLTDQQFDALWEQAACAEHAAKLSAEYPAWRARRRRTVGIAAMVVVIVAVAVPLLTPTIYHPQYNKVYTNGGTLTDSQWAELASTMLLEQ